VLNAGDALQSPELAELAAERGVTVVLPFMLGRDFRSVRDVSGDPVTVIGFASIVGRMALTSMARPLGSVRLLKIAFFGLPVAFAIWFATTRVGGLEAKFVLLIVFASILGVSYGGFVALLGDVTAHLFGLAGIGAAMGMLFFSAGTGALIGPPLMGFTADATGGIG